MWFYFFFLKTFLKDFAVYFDIIPIDLKPSVDTKKWTKKNKYAPRGIASFHYFIHNFSLYSCILPISSWNAN